MLTTRQKRYLGFGGLILLIGIAVVFGCLSLSTNYNYCVSHKGQHTTGQYDQKGSPIIEPAIEHPTAFNLFVYCSGIYANENAGGITAAATWMLMLITGGLVWLGYMQFTTTRTQLRAYVAVENVGVRDGSLPLAPGWVVSDMIIKNSGQTPARNVRVRIKVDVGEFQNPSLLPLSTDEVAGSNIPSNGTVIHDNVWMTRQLATSEVTAIQNRTHAVYVYGLIEYIDVFGESRETHFRLLHTGSWPPNQGAILYFAKGGNSFT